MKDFNKLVTTYYDICDREIKINVYACWSESKDYSDGKPADFYDIYEDNGEPVQVCLNEGDPFGEHPTREDITEYYTEIYLTP